MALEWSGYSFGTATAPVVNKPVSQESIMGPELWAALVGAVVAGIIGVATQYIVIRDNNRRQKADRKETQLALARAVFIKTSRIQSSFHNQLKHIWECDEVRKSHGLIWRHQALRPLGNLPEKVDFKAEEFAFISTLNNANRLDEFMSLDTRHNAVIPLWLLYETDRKKLEALQNPVSFDGNVATVAFTREDYLKLLGPMVALDDLIKQLERMLWDYLKETTSMLDDLSKGINAQFDGAHMPNYKASFLEDMAKFREAYDPVMPIPE